MANTVLTSGNIHPQDWSRKRILFLLHWLELGGTERQALHLAKYLRDHLGAEVEVWGFDTPGQVAQLCEKLRIPCRQVAFNLNGGRITKLASLTRYALKLRQFRPDVLLPYTLLPNVLCGAVWKWVGARGCIWQQRDAGIGSCSVKLQRWAVRSTSKFIANSSASVGYLRNTLGVEDNRIRLIHNGVALSPSGEGRAEWRRKLGLRDSDRVACMVANLHLNKDHETLLRAWRIVVDELRIQGVCSVLLLAGRFDNTHEKLKALILDLELGRNVRFLGSVNEISELLASVDLGVFSSRNEGCPNGVLECMASGLAVAATDIPGTRDALGVEGQSMLSPPGDHAAFAANIVRLLCDAGLRQQEGERNRRRVAQVFTAERMCAETTEVIAGLLSNKDQLCRNR